MLKWIILKKNQILYISLLGTYIIVGFLYITMSDTLSKRQVYGVVNGNDW